MWETDAPSGGGVIKSGLGYFFLNQAAPDLGDFILSGTEHSLPSVSVQRFHGEHNSGTVNALFP